MAKEEEMKEENEDSLIENMVKEEGPDFKISDQSVTLSPSTVKEIILEVIPMKEGEIFILGIEWELFNAVSCNYYFPSTYPIEEATEENTSK